MKKRTMGRLLAALLCVMLAGCGVKNEPPAATPAPAPQTETEVQPPADPEIRTEPEPQMPPSQGAESEKSVPAAPDPAPPADPEPAPEPQAPPSQGEEPVLAQEPGGEEASVAAEYTGTWRDAPRGTSGGRCFMEIACEDGVNYDIDIWWGSSAAETTHWQYTGTYDESWKGIDYIGTRYREVTQADGSVEKAAELEEATGLLYLEDGVLLWEDTFEHTGEGMRFSREASQ